MRAATSRRMKPGGRPCFEWISNQPSRLLTTADFHPSFDIADQLRRELARLRINSAGAGNFVDSRHSRCWLLNLFLRAGRDGRNHRCRGFRLKVQAPNAPVAANKSSAGKMPQRRPLFGSASAPIAFARAVQAEPSFLAPPTDSENALDKLAGAVAVAGAPIIRARADKSCCSSRCISASDACLESNSL